MEKLHNVMSIVRPCDAAFEPPPSAWPLAMLKLLACGTSRADPRHPSCSRVQSVLKLPRAHSRGAARSSSCSASSRSSRR
eukprot:1958173-Prymnesium_polylepis.1